MHFEIYVPIGIFTATSTVKNSKENSDLLGSNVEEGHYFKLIFH